jgi:hypothetical protein
VLIHVITIKKSTIKSLVGFANTCLLLVMYSILCKPVYSQTLFTYGNNKVTKEEFLWAYNKNNQQTEHKEQSLQEYLQLYTIFKLKVAAAKENKLDKTEQLKYDLMNFRARLENDFVPDTNKILDKIGYKKNKAIADDMFFLYADSAAYSIEKKQYPIAQEVIFWFGNNAVKAAEWLDFAKNYKLNKSLYADESNKELLQKFLFIKANAYYREHLETYSPEFTYQLEAFKEGNLLFEVTKKEVWDKATTNTAALQQYYDVNKNLFVWNESADVIFITANSLAYANYAFENMQKGKYWKDIVATSEGMIQGDSARYEFSQIPIKKEDQLVEGSLMPIVENKATNKYSFVKLIKSYPFSKNF